MARKGKWIEGFSPTDPVTSVAAEAIAARLDQVGIYVGLAAERPQSETENVHQLRVYTRRSAAALELFASLLPPKRHLWLADSLKRARKAAGAARDLDVLMSRVDSLPGECRGVEWPALLKQIRARRAAAQQSIVDCWRRFRDKKFRDRSKELISRIRWRSKVDRLTKPSYAMAGRRALRLLTFDFFSAADANLSDLESLHAFRITGKQLRYGIELYAAAFDKGLRKQIYPVVEELQEKLGAINDIASSREFLQQWATTPEDEQVAAALQMLVARGQTELVEARKAFEQWWRPGLKADLRRQFNELLQPPPPSGAL